MLLEWQPSEAVTLEMARTPDIAGADVLYEGVNKAFFISGLADGDYYLRLRAPDGEISEPLHLEVRHQSLHQALWLALLGAVATLATIYVILVGVRDE